MSTLGLVGRGGVMMPRMLNGTTEGEAAMSGLATKDDLKATVADLEELCALQVRKLTLRFGLMMAAFVLIVYALHRVL